MSENQRGLKSLLLKATEDEKLRKSFLKDPAKVAKEHGVTMNATEFERITNAAKFIDAVATLKIPIPPNGYPVEMVMQNWQLEEINILINIYAPIYWPLGGHSRTHTYSNAQGTFHRSNANPNTKNTYGWPNVHHESWCSRIDIRIRLRQNQDHPPRLSSGNNWRSSKTCSTNKQRINPKPVKRKKTLHFLWRKNHR